MVDRARAMAAAILEQWNLPGPPVPDALPSVDEPLHVLAAFLPALYATFLLREPPLGAIVWVNRSMSRQKKRFAVLHQIGHLLMHPDVVHCLAPASIFEEREREALHFAAELLMPREWLTRDAQSLALDVDALAARYVVTSGRMAKRLIELRLVRPDDPRLAAPHVAEHARVATAYD